MAQLQATSAKGFTYHQAKRAKIVSRSTPTSNLPRPTQQDLDRFEFYEKGTFGWEFVTSRPGHEFLELNLPEDMSLV